MARSRRRTARARQRRSAIALIVVCGLFVVSGAAMIPTGQPFLGLLAVGFFGVGLIVGILRLGGPASTGSDARGRHAADVAMWAACAALAAVCLALAVALALGWRPHGSTPTPQFPIPVVLTAAAIGAVLYGAGGILVAVRGRASGPRRGSRESIDG